MRLHPSPWAAALAAVLFLANLCAATEKTPFSRRNPITEAVQATKNAVVTIKVPPANGGKDHIGTGVILDERGIIVTNNHVVGSCRKPRVVLYDGTTVTAEVIFAEPRWDLAALRIQTDKKLDYLTLADTDDLMVGETCIAIGHPFGYTNTVSTGIISALGRDIPITNDVLEGLIQLTASINPGNSGGPLLNVNGELIGINCALRDGAQGIAFAIPANTVKTAFSKLLSAQRMSGVNHGLVCREKLLGETGDRQRVVVANFKGKSVEGNGLRSGDEIRAVGKRSVANAFDVERSLWDAKPGDTVELQVEREGKSLVVELTLTASTGAGPVASAPTTESQPVAQAPMARIIVGASQR